MNKKKLGLRERRARGRWKRARDWGGDCTGDSRQRLGEALAVRAVSTLSLIGRRWVWIAEIFPLPLLTLPSLKRWSSSNEVSLLLLPLPRFIGNHP